MVAPTRRTPAGEPTTARGRRTRSALLRAGREVFEQRGFGPASVDDVADEAGVSHGTFYAYFDSKEALLHAVARETVAELFTADLSSGRGPADPYARIESANRRYLTAWRRCSRIVRTVDQLASTSEQFRTLMIDLRELFVGRGADGIRHLQQAGVADASLDPRMTAIALGAMVEQVAHVWLDLGEEFDEDVVVDHLTRLWAGAIGLRRPA